MPGKEMKARARWQAVSLKAAWLACPGQPDARTTGFGKQPGASLSRKRLYTGAFPGQLLTGQLFGPAVLPAVVPGQPGPGKRAYICQLPDADRIGQRLSENGFKSKAFGKQLSENGFKSKVFSRNGVQRISISAYKLRC